MKPMKPQEVRSICKQKIFTQLPPTVYVFIGEHIGMVDFVRCLQNRNLLNSGDYMVISVDDEIYDPTERFNIMQRSEYNNHLMNLLMFI